LKLRSFENKRSKRSAPTKESITDEQIEKMKEETRYWREKAMAIWGGEQVTEVLRRAYMRGVELRMFMEGLGRREAAGAITLEDFEKFLDVFVKRPSKQQPPPDMAVGEARE